MTASATVARLAAGAAQASNVHWSIGINLPPIGTVISHAPVHAPAPVYMPAPVYAPTPVIVAPPPVVYRPVPRMVYQQPVVVGRPVPIVHSGYGHGHGQWDCDRHDNRKGRH